MVMCILRASAYYTITSERNQNMDVSLVLKIAGIGILVSVTAQILSKSGRDEQAMMVTISGLIVALVIIINELGSLLSLIRSIFGL